MPFFIPFLKTAQVLGPFFFENAMFFSSICVMSLFDNDRSFLASLLHCSFSSSQHK